MSGRSARPTKIRYYSELRRGEGVEFDGEAVAHGRRFAADDSAVGAPGAVAAFGGKGDADVLAFFDGLLGNRRHAVDAQVADGQAKAGLAMGDQGMIEPMG